MIVEKIEDERAVVELLDFEVDYGEGYLFGKPDHEAAYRLRQAA
jgi:cyclic-di-GMP phosphodiesterase TipF (flagellum assembly factor)